MKKVRIKFRNVILLSLLFAPVNAFLFTVAILLILSPINPPGNPDTAVWGLGGYAWIFINPLAGALTGVATAFSIEQGRTRMIPLQQHVFRAMTIFSGGILGYLLLLCLDC